MTGLKQKLKIAFYNPENIFSLSLHKLESIINYHFLKNWSLPPETINIYPTFRCNLKCEMCFERFAKAKQELDLKSWITIINQIKRFQPRIHLSGGEPFIYKGIIKLIEYIKINNLYLHITTNGTFLEESVDELKRFKVNRIDISIDGPGKLHDKIRGIPGTFDKIIKGLERLRKIKRHLPIIKINSLINLNRPETMMDIVKIAEEYEISSIQFIYPLYLHSDAIMSHRNFLFNTLNREINYWANANRYKPEVSGFIEIQSVINNLPRKKVMIYTFPKFNIKQFQAYYKSKEEFDKVYEGRCHAMWNTATILPDGSIESCPDYVVGNIKNEKFLDVWNNQAMAELRKIILNRKFFSVCSACCFYYQ